VTVFLGGTNVRYQLGAANQDAVITQVDGTDVATDMDFILDAFRDAYVKPFTPLHGGSPNDRTKPIPSGYVVVVPVEAIDCNSCCYWF
jgi:hypothetical protein